MITNLLNRGIYGINTGTGNDYNQTDSYVMAQYNGGRSDRYSIAGSTSSDYLISVGTTAQGALPQTLSTEIVAGTTGTLYADGSSVGSDSSFTAFTGSTNRLLLGARFLSGSVSTPGANRFQELIFFSSDESANRTDIESDINTYYSIY